MKVYQKDKSLIIEPKTGTQITIGEDKASFGNYIIDYSKEAPIIQRECLLPRLSDPNEGAYIKANNNVVIKPSNKNIAYIDQRDYVSVDIPVCYAYCIDSYYGDCLIDYDVINNCHLCIYKRGLDFSNFELHFKNTKAYIRTDFFNKLKLDDLLKLLKTNFKPYIEAYSGYSHPDSSEAYMPKEYLCNSFDIYNTEAPIETTFTAQIINDQKPPKNYNYSAFIFCKHLYNLNDWNSSDINISVEITTDYPKYKEVTEYINTNFGKCQFDNKKFHWGTLRLYSEHQQSDEYTGYEFLKEFTITYDTGYTEILYLYLSWDKQDNLYLNAPETISRHEQELKNYYDYVNYLKEHLKINLIQD